MLAWYYVVAQRERIDESALSAARELSTAVDRELGSYIVMLQALATAPELQRGDIRGFYQRASGIYNALGANIVLRAPGEAIPLMNTSVPWGTLLAGGNPEISAFEQQAVRTRQPVVSDLMKEPSRQRWIVTVMVPVLKDEEVTYILSAGIQATQFATVLKLVHLPPERASTVLDRKNIVVARSPQHDRFVGSPTPAGFAGPHQRRTEYRPGGIWKASSSGPPMHGPRSLIGWWR